MTNQRMHDLADEMADAIYVNGLDRDEAQDYIKDMIGYIRDELVESRTDSKIKIKPSPRPPRPLKGTGRGRRG